MIEVQPKDFKDDKAKPLEIAGKGTTKLWDEITSQPFNTPLKSLKLMEKKWKLPITMIIMYCIKARI